MQPSPNYFGLLLHCVLTPTQEMIGEGPGLFYFCLVLHMSTFFFMREAENFSVKSYHVRRKPILDSPH